MEEPIITQRQSLLEDDNEKIETIQQVKLFNGQIILNPTISKLNFFTYLIFALYGAIVLAPVMMIQSSLLYYTYNVPIPQQANINTITTLAMSITHFLCAPYLAVASDKYGRKPLVIFGIVITSTCTVLMPNLPSLYPYYILIHVFQGIGVNAIMAVPLLADYIDYETKGRVAGLNLVILTLGIYLSQLFNSQGNLQNVINERFYIFGTIGVVVGLIISIGLKGGMYHKNLSHDRKAEKAKRSLAPAHSKVFDNCDMDHSNKQSFSYK